MGTHLFGSPVYDQATDTYCSGQQIHLIQFFSLFNAKTGYGRLDTAKSLDNSLWSLSKSRSPKL